MSFVGRSEAERRVMLKQIGAESVEALWASIPPEFRVQGSLPLDPPLAEYEITRRFAQWAEANADANQYACFLGAGIYDHFIPAAVRSLLSRSEFATAYTPYQPEVSQGTLQTIFEYQSMICELTGMEVANASMYDGATACAEASLLATGATGRRVVLVSQGVHPHFREVIRTYASAGSFDVRDLPLDHGATAAAGLKRMLSPEVAAVLWAQPNFEGIVEDGAALTEAAHAAGAYSIASADPVALALLLPPGRDGADIVVGEGQPLGVPMGYGGPLVGFFSIRKSDVRRLPGRLAGATVDLDGRRGFVLTLQTREQHIRRERATSNICTNQALMALANTIHLALLGAQGMRDVATQSLEKAHYLARRAAQVPGVSLANGDRAFFREFVLRLPGPATGFLRAAEKRRILAGVPLSRFDGARPRDLLVAATEKRTREEMDRYVDALAEWARHPAQAPVQEAACRS
ncbi:MAG: aminomethyl-transferring glycine dehydrogenase subunit GcvPA [Candidatus Eisenbacteria bacterium]|uniref:Probable glycine dehydrogenase (decarboxylating) subunit 1 n=1 Tax=Eiseniibacteriota bacterium TaxID=2212470 RepID=A0A538SP86_UNCEI|nr:MAG: aminomethyl-transferring glycine dehydrogenase subunit GcvPA [Candidatus Eisenbacteria bacterium]TMQ62266.1 MAG: aminomethyl-transferring glycine dehydrogenase subunit GcvPA [Candidatus Eisenbacteria bacterium]